MYSFKTLIMIIIGGLVLLLNKG